ncbi:sulfatase-like hydrolase/transferase [Haloarchaeobius sp. TZWSO28]|uniref:sulfatase-like hydrolase/transferase n=1 Tax=Haloarchaeobius sp. TZWSO28 TaxID=3446119 RepID=UPI003EBAA10F
MNNRPNILFLLDDEHRPDVLGYAGDDVVRTPVIDGLAETGVVFENAYTPSPRCVPGRQCLMAGQLPRTCGCERYGDDLPPESMTWARRLAQYGYETVAAGKLHHMGTDKAQGWTKRIGMVGGCNVPLADDAPELDSGTGPLSGKWTDAKEVRRAGTGKPDVGWKDETDEYCVQGALNYIERTFLDQHYDRATPDRPVALKVSLTQPHYPYLTSEERFAYYLNRVDPFVDEAAVAFDDHSLLGSRRLKVGRAGYGIEREGDVTPREVRRATAAYYGMIETVDDYFGRVLDALEAVGEDLDEWLIIFTSDHGEMLGEHGVWEKGHFFEASARVPLVVRWPERFEPATVLENVNLCDLFATLCALTGTPLPDEHSLDSRSLLPLLEGHTDEWRDSHGNETLSAYENDLLIKHDDMKYIAVEDDRDVLFDLATDPNETTNRIEDPAYDDIVNRFQDRRDELGYGPDSDPEVAKVGYETGTDR